MDGLHRFEIEDVLRRIDLATDGTRETLLVRLKRWILFRSIIADLAAQAAVVAVSRNLDGSGGVYALDIPTPSCRRPPLVTLRQFRGKGFLRLASGWATDDVYAVDRLDRLHLLRNLELLPNRRHRSHGRTTASRRPGAHRGRQAGEQVAQHGRELVPISRA